MSLYFVEWHATGNTLIWSLPIEANESQGHHIEASQKTKFQN